MNSTPIFDVTTHEHLSERWNDSEESKAYRAWWNSLSLDEATVMLKEHSEYKAKEYDKLESKRIQRDRLDALVAAGIPKRAVRLIMFGELSETPAMQSAREFMASDDTALVLLGPSGVGKSVAASWLAAASVDYIIGGRPQPEQGGFNMGPTAMFASASDISRISMYDAKPMKALETVKYLVVDDLGVEFNDKGGSFLSRFDSIFNHRYGNELTTVITSNLTAEDFKSRYGERTVDRIREAGSFIGLDGESLRL